MKRLTISGLIFTMFGFLLFINSVNNAYSQTFDCYWNSYDCINESSCPAGCTGNCSLFGSGTCDGPHACSCPPTAVPTPMGGYITCTTDDQGNCVNEMYACAPGYSASCMYRNPCPINTTIICSQDQTIPPSTQHIRDLYPFISDGTGIITFNEFTTPGRIIEGLLRYVFPLAGLLLLLYLLYGGYNMMLSGGDPKKAALAKSIITTSLVGFIIIFISYWLVVIVGKILGLGDFETIFGTIH